MNRIRDLEPMFVEKIRDEYGSPCYLFDEESFVDNFIILSEAFSNFYPKYRIAYSYKTNYTPYICKLVRKLGGIAEVVSDFEYYVAKKVGYDESDIIYNGPYKQQAWMKVMNSGGIINIDNYQEARQIAKYADENPYKTYEVGIRLNINVGQNFISRFGVEPWSYDFNKIIDLIKGKKNLRLVGLHCHVSQCREVESWKARIDNMLKVADELFQETPPKYIDLGSGMFGDMENELKKQFGDNVPTYDDYAAVVAARMDEHYKKIDLKNKPWLYTEPGTTLISRYIFLLSTVVSHKNIQGHDITGLDSSFFNAGETCKYKKLPIHIYNNSKEYTGGDLVGYTCLEDDVIYHDYMDFVSVGDCVLLGNTGGYSVVYKPPFIQPDIPMIAIKQGKELQLIKRAQSFEDMLICFII